MKCSICIATYNKPAILSRCLTSIVTQHIPFLYEVIVVDDGSPTDETYQICCELHTVNYIRVDRQPGYNNPAKARNVAYKQAKGEIIISQDDDIVHDGNCVKRLVELVTPDCIVLPTVDNIDPVTGEHVSLGLWRHTMAEHRNRVFYIHPTRHRNSSCCFVALHREHVYAVGGNEEKFDIGQGEDTYFFECLINGLKLCPYYTEEVIGHHLSHNRYKWSRDKRLKSLALLEELRANKQYIATGGPWPYSD